MSLDQEQMGKAVSVFIGSARNYFGHIESLNGNLGYIRRSPGVLRTALDDLGNVIGSLNIFLGKADISQRQLLPNSYALRESIQRPGRVGLLPDLVGLLNANNKIACKATFKAARGLMLMGSRGETGGWTFHSSLTDPVQLVDALALELYALRVDRDFKVGTPLIVAALEEMLVLCHPNSRMFRSVSGWYTPEEGFSIDLVNLVHRVSA